MSVGSFCGVRLEKKPPFCESAEILMNDGAPCGEITQRLMKRRDVEACRQERLSRTRSEPCLKSDSVRAF